MNINEIYKMYISFALLILKYIFSKQPIRKSVVEEGAFYMSLHVSLKNSPKELPCIFISSILQHF